jgi:succinate dehydrogenase / fumarate reductase cytochrome b subunit
MADTKSSDERPLSPHLQIYKPTLTMIMSIIHRMTGAALYAGTILLAWWLMATAQGPEAYSVFAGFISGYLGRLILFFYTWALIHHMLGGIRHLVWDTGRGFDLNVTEWMTRFTVIGSIGLTIVVWLIGYGLIGG